MLCLSLLGFAIPVPSSTVLLSLPPACRVSVSVCMYRHLLPPSSSDRPPLSSTMCDVHVAFPATSFTSCHLTHIVPPHCVYSFRLSPSSSDQPPLSFPPVSSSRCLPPLSFIPVGAYLPSLFLQSVLTSPLFSSSHAYLPSLFLQSVLTSPLFSSSHRCLPPLSFLPVIGAYTVSFSPSSSDGPPLSSSPCAFLFPFSLFSFDWPPLSSTRQCTFPFPLSPSSSEWPPLFPPAGERSLSFYLRPPLIGPLFPPGSVVRIPYPSLSVLL
ncbi:hypothetical protein BU17DRAFT_101576 [Hysterangium stoloniferum]|nr:hypothetical protein BU17DRAFT_101576 [Hysterangium stoloniferum]